MKIRNYQVEAFRELMTLVETNASTAEKILKRFFSERKKLGSKDRKLISTCFYAAQKNKRLISHLNLDLRGAEAEDAMRMLVEWDSSGLDNFLNQREDLQNLSPAVLYSMPDWIFSKFIQQYGEEKAIEIAENANRASKVFLRANALKGENPLADLEAEEYQLQHSDTYGWSTTHKGIDRTEAFNSGVFEIQDWGSQQIGHFTQVKPGEMVIDACCGAGGKGLQLAALMNNVGKIWSLDIRPKALDSYYERIERAGAEIIELFEVPENPEDFDFPFMANVVLIDAPCSGSGVFSRNPDRKFRLTESELQELTKTQENLLQGYSRYVLPKGRLIYATCSIFTEENESQVKNFLKNNPEFSLDEERLILPSAQHNGFYMARMIKKS